MMLFFIRAAGFHTLQSLLLRTLESGPGPRCSNFLIEFPIVQAPKIRGVIESGKLIKTTAKATAAAAVISFRVAADVSPKTAGHEMTGHAREMPMPARIAIPARVR